MIPAAIAPTKRNGRRRPHRDFVLSETKPTSGSVSASKKRGRLPSRPTARKSMPSARVSTAIMLPMPCASRLFTNPPIP